MNYKWSNKLTTEKSPYLLQHAHNPVNWYPWGDEAFKKAKDENKPIFLSIGYSTCHWCHVMERESFEDENVANILNNKFVSIKVDREERPDIDSIYMKVCQILTGSGGWPLTIFMDHDQKPFFAGTYYPKEASFHRAGLIDILERISSIWTTDKDVLLKSSDNISRAINIAHQYSENDDINDTIIDKAYMQLKNEYEREYGGFNYAPKFPMPTYLSFLIRYYHSTGDQNSLSMVTNTLENMYKGGLYDQIGFGFSRYSTDKSWLVPHFEKMLYDNALLSLVYIETYQITKNNFFATVANEIFNYILRDMTSPDGAFYSAEDADSEGVEGKFYVWEYEEIINLLGKKDGSLFCGNYNITAGGNFEKKNIPNLIDKDIRKMKKEIREKLFNYRKKRIHPHKDDKILTSWNALMIIAFSVGGRVFNNKPYIDTAERAVSFIYQNLFSSDGRLLARYRDGEASFPAYAEDYAYLIWALIELYDSTFNINYLEKAISLNMQLNKYFFDSDKGGLFFYGSDVAQLISRPKEIYDGVIPSSNSVATINWLKLYKLTGNIDYKEAAEQQFKTFKQEIIQNPSACPYMMMSYLYSTSISKEVVIIGDKSDEITNEVLNTIRGSFNPYISVLLIDKASSASMNKLIPSTNNYKTIDNITTVYICSNNTCSKPISKTTDVKDALDINNTNFK